MTALSPRGKSLWPLIRASNATTHDDGVRTTRTSVCHGWFAFTLNLGRRHSYVTAIISHQSFCRVAHEEDSTLHLNYKVSTVYVVLFYSVCHISGGARYLFCILLFFVWCCFTSVCLFISFFSVIALSTLLLALQFSISVSRLCDHIACISLGGRIGTDTGCDLYRRRLVEWTHTMMKQRTNIMRTAEGIYIK